MLSQSTNSKRKYARVIWSALCMVLFQEITQHPTLALPEVLIVWLHLPKCCVMTHEPMYASDTHGAVSSLTFQEHRAYLSDD